MRQINTKFFKLFVEEMRRDGIKYYRLPIQTYESNEWGMSYECFIHSPWVSKNNSNKKYQYEDYYKYETCNNRNIICINCDDITEYDVYDQGIDWGESTCKKCGHKSCMHGYSHFEDLCRYADDVDLINLEWEKKYNDGWSESYMIETKMRL